MRNEIRQKMEQQWPGTNIQESLQKLEKCLKYSNLLSVFRLDPYNKNDVDVAILRSLLKAKFGQLKDQLQLALRWDRCDIARNYIFTEDKNWEVVYL